MLINLMTRLLPLIIVLIHLLLYILERQADTLVSSLFAGLNSVIDIVG